MGNSHGSKGPALGCISWAYSPEKGLITKLAEKAPKPRGKDAARFSGCPLKVKQNCLERRTNSKTSAEEVQILNSWLSLRVFSPT